MKTLSYCITRLRFVLEHTVQVISASCYVLLLLVPFLLMTLFYLILYTFFLIVVVVYIFPCELAALFGIGKKISISSMLPAYDRNCHLFTYSLWLVSLITLVYYFGTL